MLGIAFFLLSSHIGLIFPERLGLPSYVSHVLFITGTLPLWFQKLNSCSPATNSPRLRLTQFYLILVFCFALISGILSIDQHGYFALFKTGGLILTFYTIKACSSCYSAKELRHGILLFAMLEFGLLTFTWMEWNPNTISSRSATAAISSYFLIQNSIMRFLLLAIGLIVAIRFQSRTALVAMILSYGFWRLLRECQKGKTFLIMPMLFGVIILAFFINETSNRMREYAKSSLNSQNPVSTFFLSDKTKEKIDGDFFDRQGNWNYAIEKIKKNPMFGIGPGIERKTSGDRGSHNAYLAIAVEVGIPSLMLWLLIYFELARNIFKNSINIENPDSHRLFQLAIFLLLFLLMSAIFENSGFGSILAPNNIIFLLVGFWSFHQHNQNSQSINLKYFH